MKDIPGWLTSHEANFLRKAARYVRVLPGVIVEIGSFHGKSTIQLATAKQTVYAIDPHKGEYSGGKTTSTESSFRANLRAAGVNDIVRPVVKTSRQAAQGWNEPVKLLFIDGLHDYPHAREDYALWSQHLVDGGIVAMHDAFCGWPGAGRVAMDRIVRSGEYREVGAVGSIIFGVKGKSSAADSVIAVVRKLVIELCQQIYANARFPRPLAFFFVHRVLRVFLLSRFSTLG